MITKIQSYEEVDEMLETVKNDKIIIENMIYEIRGKQVMLDSDLAKLFGVATKRINEAVKNNPKKFPEKFTWVLTKEEAVLFSRSKISTLNENKIKRGQNLKYLPKVFTEQGVAMLATILKSDTAIETSIVIMDAFVAMRKYISSNLIEQSYINELVLKDNKRINALEETFSKFEEKKKINEIYFNGQIYDAYSKIYEIFNEAKNNLIIIDNYADNTILDIIKRLKVPVTIITKANNLLTNQDILKYNKQYHNLKVIFDSTYHDRYFILDDEIIYHCGASINKIGYKTFSITLINDKFVLETLLDRVYKIINR